MFYLSALPLLLLAFNAFASGAGTQAKVYKCVKDGVVTFSQLRCGDDAAAVAVKLSQGQSDKALLEKKQLSEAAVSEYVAEQDKKRALARHYQTIEGYKKQMAAEFAELQLQRFRSVDDKNNALKALKQKYDALINKQHQAIKRKSTQ